MFNKKRLKLVPIVWKSHHARLRQALREILANSANRKKFGEQFLREICGRLEIYEQRIQKLWIVNYGVIFILALQMVAADAGFTLLGVSVKNFEFSKEIFLSISVSIGLLAAIFFIAISDLKIIRDELSRALYPNMIERSLRLAALPALFGASIVKEVRPNDSLRQSLWSLLIGAPALIGFMGLICLVPIPLIIQCIATWQISVSPNLPAPWNTVVVIWVAGCLIANVGIHLGSGPIKVLAARSNH